MSEPAIRVEKISKLYKIFVLQRHDTLRDSFMYGLKSLARRNGQETDKNLLWALKDVSFEIQHGEAVGIIGRNGAGKSTLLKILSQITEPTSGRAVINGRVGSLLEIGTGFHPELSGRENIYLYGAVLGMRRAEIDRKFDEIVAFAEIEKFMDTPVKRYSSGMYVRLAFAVAAHLEPEILLVDEVLAVGDAAFQKKCLGKMGDVAERGRTVLFVSHNMTAIKTLCQRAIWIDHGRIALDDKTEQVVTKYLAETARVSLEQIWDDPRTAHGNDKLKIQMARIQPADMTPRDEISVRTPLWIEFSFWNYLPQAELNLSLHLYTLEGVCVLNSGPQAQRFSEGLIHGRCYIPGNFLNDGTYRVSIMVVRDRSVGIFKLDDVLIFDVQDIPRESNWHGKWPGVIRPELQWEFGVK